MTGSLVVGIDVGGTAIKGGVFDRAGQPQIMREVSTPTTGTGDVLDAAAALARELRAEVGAARVAAAGVVVPGIVDESSGTARYSANLGWRDVALRDEIAARLGLPVAVGQDVRAAGRAELELGALSGHTNGLLVVIGTGIAAVAVIDGTPVRGAGGLAGELGHVPVHAAGEPCRCGQRGCLEVYASAGGILRRYRERATGTSAPSSTAAIVAALEQDTVAAAVWREAVAALGLALATATLLLDPSRIVLGGGLSAAGDVLLEPVRAALAANFAWRSAPDVVGTSLGGRAGCVGAALLAFERAASASS